MAGQMKLMDKETQSLEILKEFIKKHCPLSTRGSHAQEIIVGIIQLMKNHPDYKFEEINLLRNYLPEELEHVDSCLFILIPLMDNASDMNSLKYFTLRKLSDNETLNTLILKNNPDDMDNIQPMSQTLPEKIILPSREEAVVAYVKDIVRCEAKGNYTIIYMHNQKPQLVTKTLKEFDRTFKGFKFLRTHKSHLINSDYIEQYFPNQGKIIMKDGGRAEVSRRKKELLRDHLQYHQI